MQLPLDSAKILLIGCGLRKIEKIVQTFNSVGSELLFADDAAEGLKLICLEKPSLVLCELELPDASGTDLCRTLRSNPRLNRIPVVFVSETQHGVNAVFDAMNAGADDFISEFFNSDHFLAKLIWVMEQKNEREARKQHYEALRRRQLQTLEIVRETSALFINLARERTTAGFRSCDSFEQKIEIGLGMIGGLASILDEQIRTLESWDYPQPKPALSAIPRKDGMEMPAAIPYAM